jgi:molecular chaperone DnaJ
MKYKVAVCFFIIFVLFLPIDVFANSVNISIDLPIYTDADVIAIHGNVTTETILQITIIDPDEIIVLNENITIMLGKPAAGINLPNETVGDFTYNIRLGNYDLKRSGHYDISIVYDGIKIADQFFYDSGHNVNPMKVSNGANNLSESDQITVFAIAAIIIIGVLVFLARGSFTRKKTEYDVGEWESKKNRDYEKYHSEWMSDEISFERTGKDKLSDDEFKKSLLNENLPDYYDILQISKNASQDEIKKQFRLLAKKWHPDKKQSNDAEEKMAQINMAYEVLSDHNRRKMYDQHFANK